MADLCIAVIIGRLTRDAELKYTSNGQPVSHFTVATSSRKKKGSEWVDESNFWDVDLWGKQAENISQYLTKGKLVAVEGAMRQDRWEQDGQQRMKIVISANSLNFVGGNNTSQGSRPAVAPSQNTTYQQPVSDDITPPGDDFTDDIPF
ncbi:MAG TPA: single-stranded DNA-binding protein [Spirochaetia bacterium]|nr:single-stranded DNA-binding protein [Spirochaetia bacterium]